MLKSLDLDFEAVVIPVLFIFQPAPQLKREAEAILCSLEVRSPSSVLMKSGLKGYKTLRFSVGSGFQPLKLIIVGRKSDSSDQTLFLPARSIILQVLILPDTSNSVPTAILGIPDPCHSRQ